MAGSNKTENVSKRISDVKSNVGKAIRVASDSIQTNADLAQLEKHLSMFACNTKDVIWTKDMMLNNVYVSPSIENFLGYSVEDYLNLPVDIFHTEESLKMVQESFVDVLEKIKTKQFDQLKDPISLEMEFIKKDGSMVWGEVRASLMKNDKGEPVGFWGITRDVSKMVLLQKELEKSSKKLQKSETLLQSIIENINAAVAARTLDGAIIKCNEVFKKIGKELFKMEIKEGTNLDHPNLITYKNKWKKIVEEVEKNGYHRLEISVEFPDGSKKWYLRFFSPIFLQDKSMGIAEYTRDITEFRLAEEKLREAKASAQESDKLKSAFLANISHEIRTPLNGILGFAGLLNDGDVSDSERKEYSEVIINSGKNLLRLIENLMDMSQIETNQISLYKSVIFIDDFVAELEQYGLQKIQDSAKNLELIINVQQSLKNMSIYHDRTRLFQVMSNLISNAVHNTEKGNIQIECKLNDSGQVKFAVIDSGKGINEAYKEVIFNPFRHSQDLIKNTSDGIGLGLSVSNGLVKMMGGKLQLETEENKGSMFWFSVETDVIEGYDVEFESAEMKGQWFGKKILVVEDNSVSRHLIGAMLANNGAEITIVDLGKDALSYCEKHKPDIVLLDIRLPDISGIDLIEKLHAIYPDLKVVAQTANAMQKDKVKYLSSGFSAYIAKPFNKEQLVKVVDKFLKGI